MLQLSKIRRPLIEQKEPILIRSVLLGKVFMSFFKGVDKLKAEHALQEMNKDTYRLNKHPVDLFMDGLEGKYQYPTFIEENRGIWERCLNYLVQGDPELEARISPESREAAETWARKRIIDSLKELLEVNTSNYPQEEQI